MSPQKTKTRRNGAPLCAGNRPGVFSANWMAICIKQRHRADITQIINNTSDKTIGCNLMEKCTEKQMRT
jgi:hypothetical protein